MRFTLPRPSTVTHPSIPYAIVVSAEHLPEKPCCKHGDVVGPEWVSHTGNIAPSAGGKWRPCGIAALPAISSAVARITRHRPRAERRISCVPRLHGPPCSPARHAPSSVLNRRGSAAGCRASSRAPSGPAHLHCTDPRADHLASSIAPKRGGSNPRCPRGAQEQSGLAESTSSSS